MGETTDYDRFREKVPQPGDRLDRVENLAGTGMPDTNFCAGGVECWVEYKHPIEPKRPKTPLFGSNHKVSQDQKNWFLKQRMAGGRCYFLICTNLRWMLIPGHLADDMNEMTVNELMENAIWATMKPVRNKEHWVSLRNALKRK